MYVALALETGTAVHHTCHTQLREPMSFQIFHKNICATQLHQVTCYDTQYVVDSQLVKIVNIVLR